MRAFVVLIFSFCYSLLLSAQIIVDLQNKLATTNLDLLNQYIYQTDSSGLDITRWQVLREVVPGFYEGIAYFNFYVPPELRDSLGNNYKKYRLQVLSQADSFFYYQLEERGSQAGPGGPQPVYIPIARFEKESPFSELNQRFYKTYHSPIDTSQLFIDSILYGSYCGFAATILPERAKINSWVRRKDVKSILAWLRSPNAEKQAYAVDGLLQLKKRGYKLNSQVWQLIRYVVSKEGTIKTCEGCTESAGQMKDLIRF